MIYVPVAHLTRVWPLSCLQGSHDAIARFRVDVGGYHMQDPRMSEIQKVAEAVRLVVDDYYSKNEHPLMLSSLGQVLKHQGIQLPEGYPVRSFIENHLGDSLFIERDPDRPVRVAVATAATRERVRRELRGPLSATPAIDVLYRTICVAFCRSTAPSDRVFIKLKPKIHYLVAAELPQEEGFVEIESEYRLPGHRFDRLEDLSAETRVALRHSIARWVAAHGISWSDLTAPERSLTSPRGATALDRLLEAQADEVRTKIVIPGDIIQILMSHK